MAWGDPGVTVKRYNTFQSPSVAWGQNSVRVPFNPITNIGIAKGFKIRVPYQAGTVTAGATGLTVPTALQMQQMNFYNRLQVQMAGLTASYDVRGREAGYLMYVGNGLPTHLRNGNATKLGYVDTAAGTPSWFSFPTSLAPVSMTAKKYINTLEYNHTGPVFNFSSDIHLPLTEYIKVPGRAGIDQNGNIIQNMGDTEIEVGLLVMQSAAQSVQLNAQLNGWQGADYNSVFLPSFTGYDQLSATPTFNLEHEYYDLPGNANDMPNILQTGMAVTRISRDQTISGGQFDYYFLRAGILLRVIMSFYNDTTNWGTVVDIFGDGTYTPDKIKVLLQDGQATQYINETAADNGYRSLDRYGYPPPGILVHDLLADGDGTLTQCIQTAQTTALRESLSNLPASITRVVITEERLIPVQVTQAA